MQVPVQEESQQEDDWHYSIFNKIIDINDHFLSNAII